MKKLPCGCNDGDHDTDDGYEPCEGFDCCDDCEIELSKDDLNYVPDGMDATKLCNDCLKIKGNNMGKHTPGKWEANTESDASLQRNLEVIRSVDKVVALTGHPDFDALPEEERKANARLIASAPDMYAVLKQIIDDYKNTDDPLLLQERMDANITDAEATIAKAEGRS